MQVLLLSLQWCQCWFYYYQCNDANFDKSHLCSILTPMLVGIYITINAVVLRSGSLLCTACLWTFFTFSKIVVGTNFGFLLSNKIRFLKFMISSSWFWQKVYRSVSEVGCIFLFFVFSWKKLQWWKETINFCLGSNHLEILFILTKVILFGYGIVGRKINVNIISFIYLLYCRLFLRQNIIFWNCIKCRQVSLKFGMYLW